MGTHCRRGNIGCLPGRSILSAHDPRQRVAEGVAVGQRLREHGRSPEVLAHADEDGPLPGLRDAEPLRVENLAADPVTARLQLREDFEEEALGDSLHQTADVLGDEGPWPQPFQEADELEEQVIRL